MEVGKGEGGKGGVKRERSVCDEQKKIFDLKIQKPSSVYLGMTGCRGGVNPPCSSTSISRLTSDMQHKQSKPSPPINLKYTIPNYKKKNSG